MKCKTCKQELTVITGIGYAHIINNNECPEDDGIRIHENKRKQWDATYGKPTYSLETIQSELYNFKKKNTVLNNKIKQMSEYTIKLFDDKEELELWQKKPIRQLLKKVKKSLMKEQNS